MAIHAPPPNRRTTDLKSPMASPARCIEEKMIMRFVTPVALVLALAVGGGAISAPAFAAKKEEKKAGPKLNVSPEVIKALQAAQKAAEAQDFAGAKAALA